LKRNNAKKSCLPLGIGMAVLASSLLCSLPLMASDYSFSGESNTIFRMRSTTDNMGAKKTILPAYEYLRLSMVDNRSDGSGVMFHLGAWGRADLADKSTASSSSAEGDLQYAYLTYRAPKSNAVATLGRQFISEGVAAERFDGVYLRSDFDYGFGASAFVGNSVMTETSNKGGALIYGARISHTNSKYYTVGLSALKNFREDKSVFREEEGLDLWVRPFSQVDITGRSAYNSITNGWMENNYALAYTPLSSLRIGVDYSQINIKDYLASVTTSALSLTNPVWKNNDKQTFAGASVSYTGVSNLALTADYKFYNYDKSGDAAFFGGKASYTMADSYVVGGSLHFMDGGVDRLRYTELRAFVSTKIDQMDLTLDAMNINYDKSINGSNNSYSITGAAGYTINRKLKVGADIEYSKNPDFYNEVRGLVKATYSFDTKLVAEGGKKSEK